MAIKPNETSAFVTARKGVCYLTIKSGRRNFDIKRIRSYTLDAEDKRRMRKLYPDVVFDWKKIAKQLAEKREACRYYRSKRRQAPNAVRRSGGGEQFYAIYDPTTRTIYANGSGDGIALLDAFLQIDRSLSREPAGTPTASSAPPQSDML